MMRDNSTLVDELMTVGQTLGWTVSWSTSRTGLLYKPNDPTRETFNEFYIDLTLPRFNIHWFKRGGGTHWLELTDVRLRLVLVLKKTCMMHECG